MTNDENAERTALDPAAESSCDSEASSQAALEGAETVAYWDAAGGGWDGLLRDPGARLAAAGYLLAASAISGADSAPRSLQAADLEIGPDGAFISEQLAAVQDALVEAEFSVGTELRERLTLAFDVAFEQGVKAAIASRADAT